MLGRYWIETLGCPKNQVDSDKLAGTLGAGGMIPASRPEDADVVVVNTCAFIESAREESIGVILDLAERRRDGARLVVTGCLAERYGTELADALPEVDQVSGFGVPVTLGPTRGVGAAPALPAFDLLNLPRPATQVPWAYVKIAEGCDRTCGFCAIPSFRGPQRSRTAEAILAEIDELGPGLREAVLVAQDLASWGTDLPGVARGAIVELVAAVAARVRRTRLLYLYPSELTDRLIEAIAATGVPYFDLSLQHVSKPLLRRMRRYGDATRFRERIESIRARAPGAALRSNFIVGYPGETEEDHDELLAFLRDVDLDWCGFFPYSPEAGTYAVGLDGAVPEGLVAERLAELTELADRITARRRAELIGTVTEVLVDAPAVARSHREAPEIDGIVRVDPALAPGTITTVRILGAEGPDLIAGPLAGPVGVRGDEPGDDRGAL